MKKKALDDDLAAFTKNIDEKKTETMMISVFHFIKRTMIHPIKPGYNSSLPQPLRLQRDSTLQHGFPCFRSDGC